MAVELLEFRTLLTNPLTAIPRLNSLPGAPVTIYLDFDGHTETQNWPNSRTDNQSGPVVTPVFDIDNDFTTFSDTELEMIEETWYRVAEDFMPLRVNVTTVDPGTYNDFETMLVSIGGNGSWIGSPGGIAYLGAFNNGTVNTCYVFSDNVGKGGVDHVKGMAMAASHEVGHTMDLLHHSVYDAGGNGYLATVYYRKTQGATPEDPTNTWQTYVYIGDTKLQELLIQSSDKKTGEKQYVNKYGEVRSESQIPPQDIARGDEALVIVLAIHRQVAGGKEDMGHGPSLSAYHPAAQALSSAARAAFSRRDRRIGAPWNPPCRPWPGTANG